MFSILVFSKCCRSHISRGKFAVLSAQRIVPLGSGSLIDGSQKRGWRLKVRFRIIMKIIFHLLSFGQYIQPEQQKATLPTKKKKKKQQQQQQQQPRLRGVLYFLIRKRYNRFAETFVCISKICSCYTAVWGRKGCP